ncbi:MAG TPA: SDR family oxidoreductase [Steroidobacteraceae bacterium]|jgi:NAD(P)-dependent dehydrogenase (short-subunit alcohol dehydrogenase family)
MSEFSGRVALVTGATGGIGATIIRRLAEAGASVVIGTTDCKQGDALASQIGKQASVVHLNVTSDKDWIGAAQSILSEKKRWDILINNAGFLKPHLTIEETPLDLWRHHFAVNTDGVFLGCKHAIAEMKERGGGNIVNISSGLALKVMTNAPAYCASKAAVLTLTKVAALHCAERGYNIRINAVLPGGVDTPMLERNLLPGQSIEDLRALQASRHPIGRIGTTDDVANAVMFLCSTKSSFVTGAGFAVDGGQTI